MPPQATGPSSRTRRSPPATRVSASSRRPARGPAWHKVGDRVAIAWLGKACGHCSYCVGGWETLCESQENSGYSVDGAWAEYAVAFDSHVVTVPEAVSSFDAAPLTCAGVTTFKAVKVSKLEPGETAVITASAASDTWPCSTRRSFGGRVIAVDIEDAKLDLARQLGADYVVNARTTDPVAAIRDSAAPTSRSLSPRHPGRSSRRSDRCAAAAGWCASRFRPTTR